MKQEVATIYKLTDMNMKTYGGYPWALGKWNRTSGEGDLCGPGWLHAYTSPVLAELLDPIHANFREYRVFRGEASGPVISDRGLKVGYTNMRITEELPRLHITTENRIRFGIACACRVYPSAEYRAWAGRWVSGADRSEAAARSAEVAARSAAAAAWAAEAAAAAAWAAEAAAETAAEAAAWATEVAAVAAVRAARTAAAAAWATEVAAETAAEAAAWATEVAAEAAWAAEAAAKAAVGLPLCDLATWAVGNDDLTAIL